MYKLYLIKLNKLLRFKYQAAKLVLYFNQLEYKFCLNLSQNILHFYKECKMRIYQKVIVATLLAICTSAHAYLGNGFYIGAGGDEVWTQYEFSEKNRLTLIKFTQSPNVGNFLGHGFVGYGKTYCNLGYLGVELGNYFPRVSKDINRPGFPFIDGSIQNHLTLQNFFTVDFTPGYNFVNRVLVYARIGYSLSRATLTQETVANAINFSANQNLAGLRLGVSADVPLTRHIAFGVSYIYTNYQVLRARPLFAGFHLSRFTYRPTTDDLGFHFKYTFC